MKLSTPTLLLTALAHLITATPAPASAYVSRQAASFPAQVRLYPEFGCLLDFTSAQYDIKINTCYNADDANAIGGSFLSIRGYPTGTKPDNVICETKAYFQKGCDGDAASTDNNKPGRCVNTLLSAGNDPLAVTRALSFAYECCIVGPGGKLCGYPNVA
ncbi:hypothetical protein BDW02DRAFT_599270 [Decorospora gaudefroyi]|uniref:Uncharacterized protein n=1 Tax=Decorospora gaudefroyi TaxID=184978 RepID=A0A6A5KFC0_9PLEO|nr:hypothetical protein BDW02DRAFT_599270 [Decorospora gaudefroyi]